MGEYKDLSGLRFGKLVVIERDLISKNKVKWICKCDCGNKHITDTRSLKHGRCKSCGCLRKEITQNINHYEFDNNIGIGYTSNNIKFYFDKEDYELIRDYVWYINSHGYVIANIPNNGGIKKIYMHRLVMDVLNDPEKIIDHIYHDKTDNRKINLRVVNNQLNSFNHITSKKNTSKTTGVYWHKKRKKWEALIGYKRKNIYLGSFKNKDDAIKARKRAEKELYGEYALKDYNDFSQHQ